MIWLQFITAAVLTVLAAIKLAEYGDVLAVRTRLGGMFIGTLLLAFATSLPELLTIINSIGQNVPSLAVGNIFGSSMFNMFMLALLDVFNQQTRILRRIAVTHALSAGLAVLLTGMAVFFILADIDLQIGWLGVDSLLLMVTYLGGVWLVQGQSGAGAPPPDDATVDVDTLPTLRYALLGFAGATAVLIVVTPLLVSSAAGIAAITGLSTGFIGTTLVAIVTSLPEGVTTLAATRIGAYDLAVGNLFGSNIFNIFALGVVDLFFLQGRFLGTVNPVLTLAGLLALMLTALGMLGNLARVERRLVFVELDAALIMVGYVLGMYLLYMRGVALT